MIWNKKKTRQPRREIVWFYSIPGLVHWYRLGLFSVRRRRAARKRVDLTLSLMRLTDKGSSIAPWYLNGSFWWLEKTKFKSHRNLLNPALSGLETFNDPTLIINWLLFRLFKTSFIIKILLKNNMTFFVSFGNFSKKNRYHIVIWIDSVVLYLKIETKFLAVNVQ